MKCGHELESGRGGHDDENQSEEDKDEDQGEEDEDDHEHEHGDDDENEPLTNYDPPNLPQRDHRWTREGPRADHRWTTVHPRRAVVVCGPSPRVRPVSGPYPPEKRESLVVQ